MLGYLKLHVFLIFLLDRISVKCLEIQQHEFKGSIISLKYITGITCKLVHSAPISLSVFIKWDVFLLFICSSLEGV